METMTAREAISQMNDPMKWMKGPVFSCQIVFLNDETYDGMDETSFDVDCTDPDWRDDLLDLWEEFRKENDFPEDCVVEAWATTCDDLP